MCLHTLQWNVFPRCVGCFQKHKAIRWLSLWSLSEESLLEISRDVSTGQSAWSVFPWKCFCGTEKRGGHLVTETQRCMTKHRNNFLSPCGRCTKGDYVIFWHAKVAPGTLRWVWNTKQKHPVCFSVSSPLDWNNSKTFRWAAIKFCTIVHVPQRKNPF